MYSENNRRCAAGRADAEFLRRMIGGELIADGFPVMNQHTIEAKELSSQPSAQQNRRFACDGSPASPSQDLACPTTIPSPALAMVYSPKQCWRALLTPAEGLAKGSIFSELILPLEPASHKGDKEVNPRRML